MPICLKQSTRKRQDARVTVGYQVDFHLPIVTPTRQRVNGNIRFLMPKSRHVILGFGMTIDGYIARRDGSMDFLTIDKEGEAIMIELFSKIDVTVMGSKSYANGSIELRYERVRLAARGRSLRNKNTQPKPPALPHDYSRGR